MSLITRNILLKPSIPFFQPLIQSKRLRSKINIQKPKPPHHEKAKFLMLTQPIFINPNKNKPLYELCEKDYNPYKKDEENPFQRIIAGELLRWFKSSRMVAFYHMNPMSSDNQFKAFALFKKNNMHFKNYGKKTMEMALKGTEFEAVLNLYMSRNMTVFSPEPEIKKLLKISKKFPQIILIAAILEGKFVSKEEFMEYSQIPDLKTAQVGLLQTLNGIGGQLVGQLSTHQNNLVNQLQERAKQLENT